MAKKSVSKGKGKSKQNKGSRILTQIIAGLFLPAIVVYLLISIYYSKHFYSNTTINGVNVANLTVEEAEELIDSETKSYFLTLEGRNELTDTIYGTEIGLHTVYNGSLTDLLENQNGLKWLAYHFMTQDLMIETMLVFDEELLEVKFDGLSFFQEDYAIQPEDAHISEYTDEGYKIIPEKPGAIVKRDPLLSVVKEVIPSLEPTLSLEELDVYEKPHIDSNYPKMTEALGELNKLAGTKITYEFGEITEVLDGNIISEWLTMDDNYVVTFDRDKVKDYVDHIGKTYNTFGKTRTFKTSYGDVIEIKGGDYGWWMDRKTETAELTELILKGEQLVREPAYFQSAQQYGEDDIGDTYIEVNLTAQHLYFYKDGELILETDFVSGDIKRNYGTPTGTFPVQYKDYEATLNGEDYSTPVTYWMPFYGNIGFHDAYWRKSFGKDIYLTKGSHGCINMPPKAAKKMFEHIKRGVAVLVYELEGTENYEVKKANPTTEVPSADGAS